MTDQRRVSRGVPTGGQFAGHHRDDSEVSLAAAAPASGAPTTAQARTATGVAEIRHILEHGDHVSRAALTENPAAPGWALARARAASPGPLIDLRLVDHRNTDPATLRELAGDRNAAVAHRARMHRNFQPVGLREKAAVTLERFIYRDAA